MGTVIIFNREEMDAERDEGTQMTSGHKFSRAGVAIQTPSVWFWIPIPCLSRYSLLVQPLHEMLRKVE